MPEMDAAQKDIYAESRMKWLASQPTGFNRSGGKGKAKAETMATKDLERIDEGAKAPKAKAKRTKERRTRGTKPGEKQRERGRRVEG